MSNTLFTAKEWLKYFLFSHHSKGHGIHSPWVFRFVKSVLNDKKSERHFFENQLKQKQLKKNTGYVILQDLGASSSINNGKTKRIGELALSVTTPFKYRCLLGKMVQFYNPDVIIEFGTSLGLTTNILAESTKKVITTVEGCQNIHKIALENFLQWNNQNVVAKHSDFDSFIQNFEFQNRTCFIYIDGNHSGNATLRYVEQFWKKIPDGSIIVIGDIFWSRDMANAWRQLTVPQDKKYTIDLFHVGILFKHTSCMGQHYRIRY